MARFQFQNPRTPAVPPSPSRPAGSAAPDAAALIRQRAKPRAADAIMTALTRAWFETLPLWPRPEQLCARYPRVANRLALCWSDVELTEQLFEDLLVDRRGDRKGFPAPVLDDLRRVRALHAARCEMPQTAAEAPIA